MSAPIYRDPLHDGATDPTVIQNRSTGDWWMFYTQRRADATEPGVAWVHGSRIGIAVSTDSGMSWHYRGVAEALDPPAAGPGPHTQWAPEVIWHEGRYHLYLTWIRGIPAEWHGHPRSIEHFVSADLEAWEHVGRVPLASDRVIDAAVARLPDGRFRLWFKDEAADSSTGVAVSDNLDDWIVEGVAIGGRPHEGPNVFVLGGAWWMLVDEWRGLRVHHSPDGLSWRPRELILAQPGQHPLDRQVGRHADVHVQGDEAIVFYFTHPHWSGVELAQSAAGASDEHRSAVHLARLTVADGELQCERDYPLPVGLRTS